MDSRAEGLVAELAEGAGRVVASWARAVKVGA